MMKSFPRVSFVYHLRGGCHLEQTNTIHVHSDYFPSKIIQNAVFFEDQAGRLLWRASLVCRHCKGLL